MSSLWLVFVLAMGFAHSALYNFITLYEWKQIEYIFENEDQRTSAISNGTFAVGKVEAIDFQQATIKAADGNLVTKYFVTTPRTYSRVPASLSVISNITINGNPALQPFPHWSWHVNPERCNEKRIVSASKLWSDECGRLWVVDEGYVDKLILCKPQILAFDLQTNELIYKQEIYETKYKSESTYNTLTAEVLDKRNSCLDTWLYMTNPAVASLLVFSLKLNQSWVVKDDSFEPSKKWANLTIAGYTFSLNFGIASVALSPPSDGDKRKLAYHAFANINESYVYTKELRNISLLAEGTSKIFHTYPKSRTQQSGGEAYDGKGRLHFALLSESKLVRWNDSTEYAPENFEVVGTEQEILQFPITIKVGNDAQNKESIWVFSTYYEKLVTGNFSPNTTNYKLFFANILT